MEERGKAIPVQTGPKQRRVKRSEGGRKRWRIERHGEYEISQKVCHSEGDEFTSNNEVNQHPSNMPQNPTGKKELLWIKVRDTFGIFIKPTPSCQLIVTPPLPLN